MLVFVRNWYPIVIQTINTSVKSVLDTEYLFTLLESFSKMVFHGTSFYVKSKYTPKESGFMYCFLLMLKKRVSGYGHVNPCGVQIRGHVDI